MALPTYKNTTKDLLICIFILNLKNMLERVFKVVLSYNTGQQKNNFFSKREKEHSFLGNSGVLILNLALVFF